MNLEVKITKEKLAELVGQKLPQMMGVCSFCGQVTTREVDGVHWMSVDEDFAYLITPNPKSPLGRAISSPNPQIDAGQEFKVDAQFAGPSRSQNPGHMACAVVVCRSCGYVALLSLNQLGILITHAKPSFKLIQGGAADNDRTDNVADPKAPTSP